MQTDKDPGPQIHRGCSPDGAIVQNYTRITTNEDPGNQVHQGHLPELAFLRPFPEYTGAYLPEAASPRTILGPRANKDPGISDFQGRLPGQYCSGFTGPKHWTMLVTEAPTEM